MVASQRVRKMLSSRASRCVPVSSSRATSGAPQKTPMTAGSASIASTPTPYQVALAATLAQCLDQVGAGQVGQQHEHERGGDRGQQGVDRGALEATGATPTRSSDDLQFGPRTVVAHTALHVRQHDVLEAGPRDGPAGIEDRVPGAGEDRALALGLAGGDRPPPRPAARTAVPSGDGGWPGSCPCPRRVARASRRARSGSRRRAPGRRPDARKSTTLSSCSATSPPSGPARNSRRFSGSSAATGSSSSSSSGRLASPSVSASWAPLAAGQPARLLRQDRARAARSGRAPARRTGRVQPGTSLRCSAMLRPP